MQPGEMVVARLAKGATIVRYLEQTKSRVSVALGRNRQARIPEDRILLKTGLVVTSEEEVERFRKPCQYIASSIDLEELWEVVRDEPTPMTVAELAELYWGSTENVAEIAALVIHLDQSSDYFVHGKDGYTARTREAVEEIRTRRKRRAENAAAAESLMSSLSQGTLPEPLTRNQETLLQHLRGYAIHGDDYARNYVAQSLMESVTSGTRDLQRRCFDLLVQAGVFSPDEPLELHRADIDERFPEDALAEAAAIKLPELRTGPPRRDLTALTAVTIDDAHTQDRDDALSLEMEESGADASSGGFRIGIHVSDVGALIPPGGPIDQEADRRMATLYMPERHIEMLPPGFTRSVGSLDPGETRFTMSLLVRMNASGEISGWEITPSVIRSRAALTYKQVDQALEDDSSPWHSMMKRLDQAARGFRRKRESDGAISLDRAEMDISVKPSGEVEVKVLQRSSPARSLVAELMILCNSLLADYCRAQQLPAAYRSQSAPDLSDLSLKDQDPHAISDAPGLSPAKEPVPSEVEGPFRQYLIMKRLAPAELDIIPAPHGGLGVPAYIQATSPLRRYPDLVMQRQISHFLSTGKPFYSPESVASVAQRAEVQLRELSRLEANRKRYWFLKFLGQSRLEASKSGEGSDIFHAVVLENEHRRLAMLELSEYPFRIRAELPRSCAPGDAVALKLQGVDLWRRIGHFVHVGAAS